MSSRRAFARTVSAIAVTVPVLLAFSACTDSPTGPSVAVGAQVTLAPGDRVRVLGTSLTLQFESVEGDSRCPGDAVCIQGGDATVRITVSDGGTDRRVELHTGTMLPVRYGRCSITMVELAPYPFSSRPFPPSDYRVTLRVTVA